VDFSSYRTKCQQKCHFIFFFYKIAEQVLFGEGGVGTTAYIKRSERSQIDDLILQLKLLEKQEQANPKTSRRRETIKIRTEINEIEKKIQRINETKSWFFEKINKIDRPLANLTKMRKEKTQISKIRNAKGEITTNTTEIQEIITDYFESLCSNKFENFEETDRFQPSTTEPRGY
jgi:hypothetical protein